MPNLTLVVGGQKSGKSSTAARLAGEAGGDVTVITPAARSDEEMAERIARHRRDRPAGWATVETFDLVSALQQVPSHTCVVIDAFDTWLAHAMGEARMWSDDDVAPLGDVGRAAAEGVLVQVDAVVAAASGRHAQTIVVAGQPGFGLHPMTANGRRYADLHGLALQRLGTDARILLVIAGRTLELP